MLNKRLFLVPLMLLLVVGSLQAASVSFDGDWASVSSLKDNRIVLDSGTDTLKWYSSKDLYSWGNRKGQLKSKPKTPSSLQFSKVEPLNLDAITEKTEITLGKLTYHNQTQKLPLPNFTTTLNLNGSIPELSQIPVKMTIFNTANSGNGTNDSITIKFDNNAYVFQVDNKSYTLTLLGFSTRSNGTYSNPAMQLSCAENSNQTYYLRASVAPNAVPIPATAWLLGSGLLGMLGLRRKAKN